MNGTFTLYALGAGTAVAVLVKLKNRLALSMAKHPSLAGHSKMARRVAAQLPYYSYNEAQFFAADRAPADVVATRRTAFTKLGELFSQRYAKSVAMTVQAADDISDLKFTSTYRVPFQFREIVASHLKTGSFVQASHGVKVIDIDDNELYDLTGSYGVNVFGNDFYKDCIAQGSLRVQELGAVLGSYHPVVASNVQRLREISGLDEVSFHMSGTEAVMQAVRLARYHTGRSHLVRFCGAYHGWWEDVQPGIGNPLAPHETYTLKEMDNGTLRVLRRRGDIACVLVNPLQALHPNRNAPADSALVDSSRSAHFDRAAYRDWLVQLRAVCSERGIVLIFDEVFVGFRLAAGGAQEYFGVRADMVTYGKTLGGGLPIGVVCGRRELMRRFRPQRPADICFARGTFNSHPYVMGAMQVFLEHLNRLAVRKQYQDLDNQWNAHANELNRRLTDADLPVRIANLSTIWTVNYTTPSRYNWMLQYYLRAHGLALSWVGTGRLVFSLNYREEDFAAVADRFIAAAQQMRADGWWWADAALTNKSIRRQVLKELITHRFAFLR